jgi:hypothetical protein
MCMNLTREKAKKVLRLLKNDKPDPGKMPRMLPTVTLDDGKTYFVDERLKQLRNVLNPHDFINF